MEFFDEFEITGGIIPNLIGLVFFGEVIIFSIKPEKQKLDEEKKYLLTNKNDSFC